MSSRHDPPSVSTDIESVPETTYGQVLLSLVNGERKRRQLDDRPPPDRRARQAWPFTVTTSGNGAQVWAGPLTSGSGSNTCDDGHGLRRLAPCVIGGRKANGEDRSGSVRSVEPDARPQSFCGTPADIEAHPDTTDSPCVRLIDLVKAVEDPVSLVGIDPGPRSCTRTTTSSASTPTVTLTRWFSGEYFSALSMRVAYDPIDVFLDTKDRRYRI